MRFFLPTNQPSQRAFDDAIDDMAELLSREMSLTEIAAKLHVSVGTACVLLRMLCERYGEAVQA